MIGDPLILNEKDFSDGEFIYSQLGNKKIVLIGGGSGCKKCFGKGTKFIMYDGSIKNVESIVIGDVLMGIDGTPRTVLNTHNGVDVLYEIQQTKGKNYIVSSEHLLILVKRKYNSRTSEFTGDKHDIISAKNWINRSKKYKTCHKGYKCPGFELEEKNVLLDPYFLGLWLGDGRNDSQPICNPEPEIKKYLENYAKKMNVKFSVHDDKRGNKCNSYSLVRKSGKHESTILNSLRTLNVLNNKHIPLLYKINSKKVRYKILAGLLDTDGCYSRGMFSITSKDKQLADDILWISRSLGFYCSIAKQKVKKYPDNDYYVVLISGHLDRIPTRVFRKKAFPRKQVKNHLRTGINIKEIGTGEYFGFEVNKDHKILLDDFTVVHNSEKSLALQQTLFKHKRGSLVISLDDYYLVHPTVREFNRKKQGIDSVGIKEIDWDALGRIYDDFSEGKPVHFQRVHRFLDEIEHNVIDNPFDVLIIEGLFANYMRKIYSDNLSVFIEGTPQQTLAFRKLRGKENPDNKFRQSVVQKEANVVYQLKRYTDLTISFDENNNEI